MEPILRVQNLTKTFTRSGQSNLTAVNGISFDLLSGECLGIIGESGSGKTTAVNLLTRLWMRQKEGFFWMARTLR